MTSFSILGSLAVAQGSCNPPVEPLQVGMVADETISQRMKEIFDKDQSMRMADMSEINWAEVSRVDQEHRVEVMTFIKDGKLANELADQVVKLGFEDAKWIYAASLDRYLRSIGKPQKFGTQYVSVRGCTYTLEPVDPATTDEERVAYHVPSLAEAEQQAKDLSEACDAEKAN
jgi:hypothetical protein